MAFVGASRTQHPFHTNPGLEGGIYSGIDLS